MLGPLILDIKNLALDIEEREIIRHPLVGGIILFARNYESPQQLTDLCREIRSIQPSLLITVDQEGGRVQRFKTAGLTPLPAMGSLGKLYENNPAQALALTETCGWLMAAELLAIGVDLSFAPVLDLNKNLNSVIGDRAFHSQSSIVIQLSKSLMGGMRKAGMAAIGKHFPGHGSVTLDSHEVLPIDERTWEEIAKEDMRPFIELLNSGLNGIMSSHILFSKVDMHPVTFSKYWLKTILREQLHFNGVIFSDDLNMKGSAGAGNAVGRARTALEAGCNFILMCNNRGGALSILDNLEDKYCMPYDKIQFFRGQHSVAWEQLIRSSEWKKHQDGINLWKQ